MAESEPVGGVTSARGGRRLPCTRAVFAEALRLHPPVPSLSRQARHGDRIRRREIHPGTILLAVPWLLHRHRKYWQDPDRDIDVPFNAGARDCLGLRSGLTEGILCLATLAQRFQARLQPRLDQWLWLPYFEPDRPLPSPGSRDGGGGASTTSQVPSGR
jgi:cytochrome P450